MAEEFHVRLSGKQKPKKATALKWAFDFYLNTMMSRVHTNGSSGLLFKPLRATFVYEKNKIYFSMHVKVVDTTGVTHFNRWPNALEFCYYVRNGRMEFGATPCTDLFYLYERRTTYKIIWKLIRPVIPKHWFVLQRG